LALFVGFGQKPRKYLQKACILVIFVVKFSHGNVGIPLRAILGFARLCFAAFVNHP
jgi:hypothetical protein